MLVRNGKYWLHFLVLTLFAAGCAAIPNVEYRKMDFAAFVFQSRDADYHYEHPSDNLHAIAVKAFTDGTTRRMLNDFSSWCRSHGGEANNANNEGFNQTETYLLVSALNGLYDRRLYGNYVGGECSKNGEALGTIVIGGLSRILFYSGEALTKATQWYGAKLREKQEEYEREIKRSAAAFIASADLLAAERKRKQQPEVKNSTDHDQSPEKDAEGRTIIRGPIDANLSPIIENVHVVSDSYGVIAHGPTMIKSSVIDAKICVQSSGNSLILRDNVLNCGLGVEFTSGVLMDNQFSNNRYSGQLTNRPDVFGH